MPYLTISGRGYYDRPEVQDLISLLGALSNPADDLNLAAALRSPLFCFSDNALYTLRWYNAQGDRTSKPIPYHIALKLPPRTDQAQIVTRAALILEQLWSLANRIDVWSLLRKALDLTDYESILASLDGPSGRQLENVHKFIAFARDQASINLLDFLGRIRDLKTREAREGEALGREPESGAVQLMSIHAAKGLEFPVVILADIGRSFRNESTSPYLLHDPAFGLVCKVRDKDGDWQAPVSYAWGKWQHNYMEEAERKRLLYVACTRAADRLILTGQLGNKDSWLSEIIDLWKIKEDGFEQENLVFKEYSIQVARLKTEPQLDPAIKTQTNLNNSGLEDIPLLALPIANTSLHAPISVSQLEQSQIDARNIFPVIRLAIWNIEQPSTNRRAPGYLVGELVHKALAHWDCLEYTYIQCTHYLETHAQRITLPPLVIADAVNRAYKMLKLLKRDDFYRQIQNARQRYHEMPFNISTDNGLLHGMIDLLYQDQNEVWHLIDWKTEWTPSEEIEKYAQQYFTQMAAYTLAVHRSLGHRPEISLCFLNPQISIYTIPYDKIDEV